MSASGQVLKRHHNMATLINPKSRPSTPFQTHCLQFEKAWAPASPLDPRSPLGPVSPRSPFAPSRPCGPGMPGVPGMPGTPFVAVQVCSGSTRRVIEK